MSRSISSFKADEFIRRRRQLMRMTGEGSALVIPAATEKIRSNDVYHPYRQSSDFFYLSGFPEPEAVLVLLPGREQGESILFCRERDIERERWDGSIIGLERACLEYSFDDAFPIADIDDILPNLMEGRERLYYTLGKNLEFDQHISDWIRTINGFPGRHQALPLECNALDHFLHDMRLYKSRSEVSALSKAAKLGAQGHIRAMQRCRPGMAEYQLAAELMYVFNQAGACPSYAPIVGGGNNACVLHYIANQDELKDGDLVLVDVGAELNHYACDITRTYPVNGRFSGPQRDIYEVVLAAQLNAIDHVRKGNCWDDPHQAATRTISEGLIHLGLLKCSLDECMETGAYQRFYMHKTGHWLGIDVHDVGDYHVSGQPRELETGMVLTVEPGVYINAEDESVDPHWRGIGVRIEDDVVVTKDTPRVLSSKAPKTVSDIESVMAA